MGDCRAALVQRAYVCLYRVPLKVYLNLLPFVETEVLFLTSLQLPPYIDALQFDCSQLLDAARLNIYISSLITWQFRPLFRKLDSNLFVTLKSPCISAT